MLARVPKTCQFCGQGIDVGERLLPLAPGQGVVHVLCGQQHGIQPPECRHWLKGHCVSGDECFFRHSADAVPRSIDPKAASGVKTKAGRKPRNAVNKKFRASVFRRFLMDQYGVNVLAAGSGVLDVAAGKGSLAFEFVNLCGIPCTTLDPRPPDVRKVSNWLLDGLYHRTNPVFRRSILRSLGDCQASGPLSPRHIALGLGSDVIECVAPRTQVPATLAAAMRQLQHILECAHDSPLPIVGHEDGEHEDSDVDSEGELLQHEGENEKGSAASVVNAAEVYDTVRNASAFVGMHPDHATEPIVDLALRLGKPFAVVPCCVCARSFPDRRLPNGTEPLSYDAFIEYLVSKAPDRIRTAKLDFEGRNTVVYSRCEPSAA